MIYVYKQLHIKMYISVVLFKTAFVIIVMAIDTQWYITCFTFQPCFMSFSVHIPAIPTFNFVISCRVMPVMCRGKDKTNSSLNPIITWSDHSRDPYINNHNNNTLYHSLSLITKSH